MIGILVQKLGKMSEMNKSLDNLCFSARFSDDAGHRKFTDEVYEHQYRLLAGAQWQPKAVGWTDLVKLNTSILIPKYFLLIGW